MKLGLAAAQVGLDAASLNRTLIAESITADRNGVGASIAVITP